MSESNTRSWRWRLITGAAAVTMGASLFGFVIAGRTSTARADTTEGTTSYLTLSFDMATEQVAMSGDARYVVFRATGSGAGIYLLDQQTGLIKTINLGQDANPSISPDGRYVTYTGTVGGTAQIHLVDTRTGADSVVSVNSSGVPGDAQSGYSSVSSNGRYVAFQSMASNLTTATTASEGSGSGSGGSGGPGRTQVYVHDTKTGQTTLVSVTPSGTKGAGNSEYPRITPDGRYIAFQSAAPDLTSITPPALSSTTSTEGETEVTYAEEVYVRDMTTGTTVMASVSGNTPGDNNSADDYGPSISNNGTLVAFGSLATNLVPSDSNGQEDAFVHNMATGANTRVSLDSNGGQVSVTTTSTSTTTAPTSTSTAAASAATSGSGNGSGSGSDSGGDEESAAPSPGADPQISGDGTHVVFQSAAPLTSDDTNGVIDVYETDLATGAIQRVSVSGPGGTDATGTRTEGSTGLTIAQVNGQTPAISTDGRYVVFVSNGNLTGDRPASTDEGDSGGSGGSGGGSGSASAQPAAESTTSTATSEVSTEEGLYMRTINSPTVTGVTPNSMGRARDGQTITVTGTNFTPPSAPGDTVVNLGSGTSVSSVTWVSSTTLKVTMNVAPTTTLGARNVSVQNPGRDSATEASALTITPRGNGYRMVASDGGVFAFGSTGFRGSMGGAHLNQPVVGMAETSSGNGYWLVASDGGVFSFGDAVFYGSTGNVHLNKPIVGMAATPDGHGYWLVASDGGVFSFGDAAFYGSTGNVHLNKPIVGMAATPDGHGYWLVASDGGVFTFGDAAFYGSTGNVNLNKPIVGMESAPGTGGYWLVASDGGVFTFGGAQFYGSTGNVHLNKPIVGIEARPDGGGYWLVASDGGVFSFGNVAFRGSTGNVHLSKPIVGLVAD